MSAGRKSLLAVWRDTLRDSELSSTVKLVGHTLSTWMNGRGTCWPSRSTIAKGASLSDRSVDAALDKLSSEQFLEIKKSQGGNQEHTNLYTATLPAGANEVRRSEWERANLTTPRGETDDSKGRTSFAQKRVESERKARTDAAAPDGASSVLCPEDDCPDCGKRVELVGPDFIYCRSCAVTRATAAKGRA